MSGAPPRPVSVADLDAARKRRGAAQGTVSKIAKFIDVKKYKADKIVARAEEFLAILNEAQESIRDELSKLKLMALQKNPDLDVKINIVALNCFYFVDLLYANSSKPNSIEQHIAHMIADNSVLQSFATELLRDTALSETLRANCEILIRNCATINKQLQDTNLRETHHLKRLAFWWELQGDILLQVLQDTSNIFTDQEKALLHQLNYNEMFRKEIHRHMWLLDYLLQTKEERKSAQRAPAKPRVKDLAADIALHRAEHHIAVHREGAVAWAKRPGFKYNSKEDAELALQILDRKISAALAQSKSVKHLIEEWDEVAAQLEQYKGAKKSAPARSGRANSAASTSSRRNAVIPGPVRPKINVPSTNEQVIFDQIDFAAYADSVTKQYSEQKAKTISGTSGKFYVQNVSARKLVVHCDNTVDGKFRPIMVVNPVPTTVTTKPGVQFNFVTDTITDPALFMFASISELLTDPKYSGQKLRMSITDFADVQKAEKLMQAFHLIFMHKKTPAEIAQISKRFVVNFKNISGVEDAATKDTFKGIINGTIPALVDDKVKSIFAKQSAVRRRRPQD